MKHLNRRQIFQGGVSTLLAVSAAATSTATAPQEEAVAAKAARTHEVEESLWLGIERGFRIWGYTDKQSVAMGESFDVMLSCGPRDEKRSGKIIISRLGEAEASDVTVWSSDFLVVGQQSMQAGSASTGAAWSAEISDIQTTGWQSGIYLILFENDQLTLEYVAFLVVRGTNPACDICYLVTTNTYLAYNTWGGGSFYEYVLGDRYALQQLSFDRPPSTQFFEYDIHAVRWLVRYAKNRRLSLNFVVNHDIFKEPDLALAPRIFVTGAHNEYCSLEEFLTLHRRIHQSGGHCVFLGANNTYWKVRYVDVCAVGGENRGRQVVCYKELDDPIGQRLAGTDRVLRQTTRFRENALLPETMLGGVAFESWFSADDNIRYPYRVVDTTDPLFQGTGWTAGQTIGDLVGYEWDNRDPVGDGHRLWDPQASVIAPIPSATIRVLFFGEPVDINRRKGRAEGVYFVSGAGARVFSSGTIRWSWGFGREGYATPGFTRFNENLLDGMLNFI